MNQRDRLIKLIEDYTDNVTARELHSQHFDEKFADYLLANGVIVPPCKVGDKVYVPSGDEEFDWVDEYKVKYFYCSSEGIDRLYIKCGTMGNNFRPKDIGKTVFLTRGEAEKALEEMKK